jgi:hypothetical protein
MPPVFMARNLVNNGSVKIVGPTGEHLKMEVFSEESHDLVFQCHCFPAGRPLQYDPCLGSGSMPAYTVEENIFKGKTNWQLEYKGY